MFYESLVQDYQLNESEQINNWGEINQTIVIREEHTQQEMVRVCNYLEH